MTEANQPTTLPASEAILSRRATRSFDPNRPLPESLLKAILHLATHAPSSLNLQPWRFLVVRSEANRKRLRACAFNQPKVTEAPVMIVVLGYLHPDRTHLDAVIQGQVDHGTLSREGAAETRGRATASMAKLSDRPLWSMRSTMLSVATLMIAAESLGVASAPMEGFDHEKVKETFGVPDDHIVCCLVALGYALQTKPFPGRFGLSDVCYLEHFGQPWTLGEVEASASHQDGSALIPQAKKGE